MDTTSGHGARPLTTGTVLSLQQAQWYTLRRRTNHSSANKYTVVRNVTWHLTVTSDENANEK